MALYLIVVQAHFIMNNIFEGMIWLILPASLVITNDIFAYICGITFGRTQLIKLSPKKTVEGFVGAWILTIIFGFAMTNVLIRYQYFICPVDVSVDRKQPRTDLTPLFRTLAPTYSQASPATPIPSSFPKITTSQHGPMSCARSRSRPYNSISSYLRPLPP